MKKVKRLWACILVVAMILTFMPGTTYVMASTDATYGFHVSGSKLLDANGNQFIMRGINHAHTWYKGETTTALKAMAKTGANTVRLVLSNGAQWNKDDLSSVKSLIKQCKDNKMVAVLEVHDATGKQSTSELLAAADYFVEMKSALIGNEAYVIVNIANEWDGTWESSTWKAGYKAAIKKLRDAGIKNTIMVDAAGWGQYPKSIAESGKAVFASDPLANTMFSTHMYEYAGGTASMVKNNIDSVAKTGLCQVIGEFGWKHTDGDVAEKTIMSYCEQKQIGYMAWSWKGNSGGVEYLDLANDWAGTSLSDWGDEVVNGANGLKQTSKVCSVFSNSASTEIPEASEKVTAAPVAGSINIFTGSKEASSWTNVLELTTVKNGGTFDPAVITKDGYFAITYTGTKDCLQVIFQSWTGGSGWAIVKPADIKNNADGSYTAVLDYATVTDAYGTSYDLLDRIYVQTQNGNIVLKAVDYVTGKTAPVVSVEPSVAPSIQPSVQPSKMVEPSEVPAVSNAPITGALAEETFRPTDDNVKAIGRTYVNAAGERWLANTASGIEFTFNGTKGTITILGDFLATGTQPNNQARFAIYVNDKLFADEMLDEATKTYDFYNGDVAPVTVKVIKLSESQAGTVGIGDITITSTNGIKPTEAKAHKIEFIGDSITCGYGIDDENITGGFKNSTEDGSKTYAYKTAMNLDADYSIVSVSGIGVISNYTGAGSKNDENVMPKYYEKLAYSWAAFGDWTSPAKVEWDFNKFQPDAVVINLGTNDSSYVAHDATRGLEFVEGYVEFIKQIRSKNPDATIFCTLGIMGADLYPQIEQAVETYTAQTGDKKVTAFEFDSQQMSDGICVDWHPSEKTNTKAAAKLTAYIKSVMGW